MMRLRNKKVLLGITGSVAAYKSIDIIRRLRDEEASVKVVVTEASKRFVTPLSVEIASAGAAFSGVFDNPMAHVELAREADLMLVAPATANTIGKFACGLADDMISTCFLACRAPVLVAPAMNWRMYTSPAVTRNLALLKDMGVIEVPPEEGLLACGEEGRGRMAPLEDILEAVRAALTVKDLAGVKIVVTAGPTREYMDGVRFISNRSSGKMGYALARVARRRGAEVVLISGPSALAPPAGGVRLLRVESAQEMKDAVMRELKAAHAVIMAAAVADFKPAEKQGGKPEKESVSSIKLSPTDDILAAIGSIKNRPALVGFAAEAGGGTGSAAGSGIKRARKKLLKKGADFIVFNDIDDPESGFDVDTNRIVIVDKGGEEALPLLSKEEAAWAIIDRLKALMPEAASSTAGDKDTACP